MCLALLTKKGILLLQKDTLFTKTTSYLLLDNEARRLGPIGAGETNGIRTGSKTIGDDRRNMIALRAGVVSLQRTNLVAEHIVEFDRDRCKRYVDTIAKLQVRTRDCRIRIEVADRRRLNTIHEATDNCIAATIDRCKLSR